MKKPKPTTRASLDWSEVEKYLKEEKGIDLDDRSSRYKSFYLAYLCDRLDIRKDSYFWLGFDEDDLEYEEPWVRTFLELIRDEFSEYIDNGGIEFWIGW